MMRSWRAMMAWIQRHRLILRRRLGSVFDGVWRKQGTNARINQARTSSVFPVPEGVVIIIVIVVVVALTRRVEGTEERIRQRLILVSDSLQLLLLPQPDLDISMSTFHR